MCDYNFLEVGMFCSILGRGGYLLFFFGEGCGVVCEELLWGL